MKIKINCPSCATPHEIKPKSLSNGMVETLVLLCRFHTANPQSWVDVKEKGISENDCQKLLLWNLVQTAPASGRKKKSGLWVPTQQGYLFAKNSMTIPKSTFLIGDAVAGYSEDFVAVEKLSPHHEALWTK